VLEKVALVARTGSSVLVLGETGTGKELVARAVHDASERKERPFVKVNCAALPAGLIESELFGHERGAFTGATQRRIGRFELADTGTLFLDEIGDMPLDVQTKLLRILQEQQFERVGGQVTLSVDVRVIAATNRDLAREAEKGTFRSDLFYRLNVFPIAMPPLRERRDDIPLLVQYFLGRYAAKIGRKGLSVPAESMRCLVAYDWPGNVRELENVIERAVILAGGDDAEVSCESLGIPTPSVSSAAGSMPGAKGTVAASSDAASGQSRGTNGDRPAPGSAADTNLSELERRHIESALERSAWRIEGPRGAARILGMNPSTLRSRMKKLGIGRGARHA